MRRKLLLAAYGLLSYIASLTCFLFVFAWLGGPVGVAFLWQLDGSIATISINALGINAVLFIGFGLYHSLMARSLVKQRLRQFLPRTLERATYTLISSALTALLCLLWHPISPVIWAISSYTIMRAVVLFHLILGACHLKSFFLINHNDFFALRHIGPAIRVFASPPLPPISNSYYLCTRLMLVLSLALIPWVSPIMTVGRLQ